MSSYRLLLLSPDGGQRHLDLQQAQLLIGRETGGLVLEDTQVSGVHARLLFDGTTLRLEDLQSTNGTWLDGRRLTQATLKPGMTFQIGRHRFTVEAVGAEARPEAPSDAPRASPGRAGNGPRRAPWAPGGDASRRNPPRPERPAMGSGDVLRWVLLAGALVVASCTVLIGTLYYLGHRGRATQGADARSPSNLVVPMKAPREATVQAVWFSGKTPAEVRGGTAPTRLRVGPNTTGQVSVAVAEQFAGATGNQWRTAAWVAAFNATRAVGVGLGDYEFQISAGGHVDGPSAGLLTTAGLLALLRAQPLDAGATLTGTINPDGSAGPVGGIVQKMEGAKAAGLRRFGFPAGTRTCKDERSGVMTDLLAKGRELGLEVKELADLYEAYQFMTGSALPRPTPLTDGDMALSPETLAPLTALVEHWRQRLSDGLAALGAELPKQSRDAGKALSEARAPFEAAQALQNQGQLAAALEGYVRGSVALSLRQRATAVARLIEGAQYDKLLATLRAAGAVEAEVLALERELQLRAQDTTRGGQVAAADAYARQVTASAAVAIGKEQQAQAEERLKAYRSGKSRGPQALQDLLSSLVLPLVMYDVANTYVDYARDLLGLVRNEGKTEPMSEAALAREVAGYTSGGAAVLAYFDALILDAAADQTGQSPAAVRARFAEHEPEYLIARKANELAEFASGASATPGSRLMRLSAAALAYLSGARFVNEYYALGAHRTAEGKLLIEQGGSLGMQLQAARRNALISASSARTVAGFVPTPARLAYQSGVALQAGTDEERLAALSYFWQAGLWCDLVAAN